MPPRKSPSEAQRIARLCNGWLRNVAGAEANAVQTAHKVGMDSTALELQFLELVKRIKMQRDKLLRAESEKKLKG